MKKLSNYFTKAEIIIWVTSVIMILGSFLISQDSGLIGLIASLVGVTALILCAKGNPVGQVFMIVFCCIYTYISYTFSYYGEMITYLGMSGPMALLALISWLKHPYKGNRSEVKVGSIKGREVAFMLALSGVVTVIFYYILAAFNTANLLPSTLSVTTSFIAVYLTFRRSPYYAIAYAANDIVLIILWTVAAIENISYLSVIICFAVFFVNDIYGFANWQRMKKRQGQS